MRDEPWSLQDAKNRFSAVVEAARRGEPQLVTKRGAAAVVVLAAEEYARLKTKSGKHRRSSINSWRCPRTMKPSIGSRSDRAIPHSDVSSGHHGAPRNCASHGAIQA